MGGCADHSPHFVVLGNPERPRIQYFQTALRQLGLAPATVIAYQDWLTQPHRLEHVLTPQTILRIESPGRNFTVEKLILAQGVTAAAAEASPWIDAESALALPEQPGRILYPRQWYLGFCQVLAQLQTQITQIGVSRWMASPAEIPLLFDKILCQALFQQQQIPIPQPLGSITCFDALINRLQATGCRRVFIKLAHGSSASGVMALALQGPKIKAWTTVEVVSTGPTLQLYNSRKIQQYQDLSTIAAIVDQLCRERVQVEAWVPKMGLNQQSCDLRVVVIGGKARQAVVRLSHSPMTNLHLLNQRSSPEQLIARVGTAVWDQVLAYCEQVAQLFPHSLHLGVDVAVLSDHRRIKVLEANAFGDLLPQVTWRGLDTYTTEIKTVLQQLLPVNAL
ncbi:STM4014 family protein [Acaryochloris sp. IP29b_bin.148]|uniref:STM4014 family protein n=1 Tax=Acaryochloris sp. IP29b_bin.148 TaxID=2969218 RepID=UPI002631D5A8|nr:STM4014 family protein [Acaryochloris sp. IP29b_bin.148]